MGSSDSEKDFEVMMDNQLSMSSQHDAVAKRPNVILGCINQNLEQEYRGYFTSEFGTVVTAAGIVHPVLISTI